MKWERIAHGIVRYRGTCTECDWTGQTRYSHHVAASEEMDHLYLHHEPAYNARRRTLGLAP